VATDRAAITATRAASSSGDGSLTITDPDGKELASFAKGKWTAVGRMRTATESSDDE